MMGMIDFGTIPNELQAAAIAWDAKGFRLMMCGQKSAFMHNDGKVLCLQCEGGFVTSCIYDATELQKIAHRAAKGV